MPKYAQLAAHTSRAEQTLEETKSIVRKKLSLPSQTSFRLVQLRGGSRVDLEDGAFKFVLPLSCPSGADLRAVF